jgi:hypothetical protein
MTPWIANRQRPSLTSRDDSAFREECRLPSGLAYRVDWQQGLRPPRGPGSAAVGAHKRARSSKRMLADTPLSCLENSA